ncbi:MAG: ParB/RepB/Spo0J family partition protein, partial [Eubacteriales bacterium]|nr:ParB/RepB/Spo0J family partition protein [Eubacteriales bacterium]
MKSPAKNISLTSLDDLFATDESRAEAAREKVLDIPLDKLHEFPNHPFKVRDDESMKSTVESVEKYGVLVPAIVRERGDGEYEIIAGHRRHHASVLAGRETLPCLVRDLDDDEATIFMVDT